jgi:hypothetical protein
MTPLTRRSFSGAAALSCSKILGANDRVRMGYIGLGNRGDQVHDAFLEHPRCGDRGRLRPARGLHGPGRAQEPRHAGA